MGQTCRPSGMIAPQQMQVLFIRFPHNFRVILSDQHTFLHGVFDHGLCPQPLLVPFCDFLFHGLPLAFHQSVSHQSRVCDLSFDAVNLGGCRLRLTIILNGILTLVGFCLGDGKSGFQCGIRGLQLNSGKICSICGSSSVPWLTSVIS